MEPELGKAVREAAEAEGMSVSAWIAEAAAHRVRLKRLDDYFAAFEAEHGAFTEEEIAAASEFMRDAEREAHEKVREMARRKREAAA